MEARSIDLSTNYLVVFVELKLFFEQIRLQEAIHSSLATVWRLLHKFCFRDFDRHSLRGFNVTIRFLQKHFLFCKTYQRKTQSLVIIFILNQILS